MENQNPFHFQYDGLRLFSSVMSISNLERHEDKEVATNWRYINAGGAVKVIQIRVASFILSSENEIVLDFAVVGMLSRSHARIQEKHTIKLVELFTTTQAQHGIGRKTFKESVQSVLSIVSVHNKERLTDEKIAYKFRIPRSFSEFKYIHSNNVNIYIANQNSIRNLVTT